MLESLSGFSRFRLEPVPESLPCENSSDLDFKTDHGRPKTRRKNALPFQASFFLLSRFGLSGFGPVLASGWRFRLELFPEPHWLVRAMSRSWTSRLRAGIRSRVDGSAEREAVGGLHVAPEVEITSAVHSAGFPQSACQNAVRRSCGLIIGTHEICRASEVIWT